MDKERFATVEQEDETIEVVAGLVRAANTLLITQRPDNSEFDPGSWEFPGGKR